MTAEPLPSHVSWREVVNRHYGAPLLLVSLGVWLHAADSLIVATMMPQIVAEIGGEAYVAWSVALYELGSIVAGACGALLVLHRGVRIPMMLAALVFAAGCLASAAAPTMPLLLSGRLLQGVGGGGLTALAFIAVATLFPARLTPRVFGIISVLWGASAFLGPLIGGLFVEYSTWRMGFVFFAAQAVGLALWIWLGIRLVERKPAEAGDGSVPIGRLMLLTLGVLMIAYAGIDVTVSRTPILLVLGLMSLLLFLWQDARSGMSRLLPKQPFNLRTPVGSALVMTLTMAVSVMGLGTYGPLLMTIIHGYPAYVAGYVLASVAIGWSVAAIVLSGSPERYDRFFIAIGLVMVFCSVAGLAYAIPNGPLPMIAVFASLEGIGFGTAWTFVLRRAKRLAAEDDVARLSGALPTVSRFGYALGASVCGILANAAGFSLGGSADQAARVARVIFIGNLPIALLGLFAMSCFVSLKGKRAEQGERAGKSSRTAES
ncbi:MAG: MFS transporter [Alphaproteobacteria bacterium]|nr:MFS transporter [Alphaproteobacteria bacterium]